MALFFYPYGTAQTLTEGSEVTPITSIEVLALFILLGAVVFLTNKYILKHYED